MHDDEEQVKEAASKRLREAESLLSICATTLAPFGDGAGKLANLIRKETSNLQTIVDSDNNTSANAKCVFTSNLSHYAAVIDACCKNIERLHRIMAKIPVDGKCGLQAGKSERIQIDLMLDHGTVWMKVIARSWRGIYTECMGGGGTKSGRNILEQGELFVEAARNNEAMFRAPHIVFVFVDRVPSTVKDDLEALGIEVRGDVMPVERWNIDSDEEDIQSAASVAEVEAHSSDDCDTSRQYVDAVNLDVPAMLALCSNLTNGHTCYHFKQKHLNTQAQMERLKPALPYIFEIIKGRRLIVCETARTSFENIVATVGGANEKERAEILLRHVIVVPDRCTKRVQRLRNTDVINERSQAIFGAGDYYRAVTLTANRHLISAAEQQGVRLAAIVHESRVLSEQKQEQATRIEGEEETKTPRFTAAIFERL